MVKSPDEQYTDMCLLILNEGEVRDDRTGTGTVSIFSHQMQFDLREGFPLLTTKDMRLGFKHTVGEMLWMLEGNTNAHYLAEKYGFTIWRKWADADGELGPVYGHQWRNFNGVDQITWVMNELKTNPFSRRMLVSAWNPADMDYMVLPPCHWSFELYVNHMENTLNMKLHQRSCDVFLGVPYNMAEYAILLEMMAHVSGYTAGLLVHDLSNVHIYRDHVEKVRTQIQRKPYQSPRLTINRNVDNIFDFVPEDFELIDYRHHDKLTGEVSV